MSKTLAFITTAQAAEILDCGHEDAKALLKAAGVSFQRMGYLGAYLWDVAGVNCLLSALGRPSAADATVSDGVTCAAPDQIQTADEQATDGGAA